MLQENGIDHTYREYTKEPLTVAEIKDVLAKLGMGPTDILRGRDAKKAGLTGAETTAELISLMAENPRLMQRPIGVVGDKAVIGRPAEALLELF